jgi:hypothetical protein
MDLRPTPESWRVALATASGAAAVAAAAAIGLLASSRVPGLWVALFVAGVATLVPALGALTASVDVAASGVRVRRLGWTRTFSWDDIVGVRVVERRANVPDGTEYHWWVPSRSAHHMVSIPALELADGATRALPALAARAGDELTTAQECAAAIERYRSSYAAESGAAIA